MTYNSVALILFGMALFSFTGILVLARWVHVKYKDSISFHLGMIWMLGISYTVLNTLLQVFRALRM